MGGIGKLLPGNQILPRNQEMDKSEYTVCVPCVCVCDANHGCAWAPLIRHTTTTRPVCPETCCHPSLFLYIYIIRLGIDEQGQPTRPVSPDHHDQQVRSPPGNEKEEEKCTTMVGFVLTKGQKNG